MPTLPTPNDFEAIRDVPVIVSVIIATATFVISQLQAASSRRYDDIDKWSQVAIQQLMQKEGRPLKFSEIVASFRTTASAYSKYRVKPNDLSEERIRSILLKLIAKGIVDQSYSDTYLISSAMESRNVMVDLQEKMFGKMDASKLETSPLMSMQGLMQTMIGNVSDTLSRDRIVRDAILGFVSDHQFKYAQSDLIMKICATIDHKPEIVKARLTDLLASSKLTLDETKKIGINFNFINKRAETEDDDDDDL